MVFNLFTTSLFLAVGGLVTEVLRMFGYHISVWYRLLYAPLVIVVGLIMFVMFVAAKDETY